MPQIVKNKSIAEFDDFSKTHSPRVNKWLVDDKGTKIATYDAGIKKTKLV